MNSAAIYATAGFTSYWSCAEYVVKKHLIPIDIIITYTLLDIGTKPDQDPYFKSGYSIPFKRGDWTGKPDP